MNVILWLLWIAVQISDMQMVLGGPCDKVFQSQRGHKP